MAQVLTSSLRLSTRKVGPMASLLAEGSWSPPAAGRLIQARIRLSSDGLCVGPTPGQVAGARVRRPDDSSESANVACEPPPEKLLQIILKMISQMIPREFADERGCAEPHHLAKAVGISNGEPPASRSPKVNLHDVEAHPTPRCARRRQRGAGCNGPDCHSSSKTIGDPCHVAAQTFSAGRTIQDRERQKGRHRLGRRA